MTDERDEITVDEWRRRMYKAGTGVIDHHARLTARDCRNMMRALTARYRGPYHLVGVAQGTDLKHTWEFTAEYRDEAHADLAAAVARFRELYPTGRHVLLLACGEEIALDCSESVLVDTLVYENSLKD
jgi:hypothetical protein